MTSRRNVFISYSHNDKSYCSELIKHLKPLKDEGLILVWHDGEITPGLEWNNEIIQHLNQADIIILLISVDFINSDYISKIELPRALERHENKEVRVIPIIIRCTPWENFQFAKLNVLPDGAEPVQKWKHQDEAYVNIVQGLRKAIGELKIKESKSCLLLSNQDIKDNLGKGNIDPENEYYRFYGLKGLRSGPIVQDFCINRTDDRKELNLNPIQYLWTDVFFGNTVNAHIVKNKKQPNLRVFFDHKGGWGCNIAIRPQCKRACHNERGWKYLAFDARIPEEELEKHPDYLREVGVSVRLINARFQHWEYSLKPNEHIIKCVEDVEWGGESILIDLEDKDKWHKFVNDGNVMRHAEKADFSVIAGVVLKFGSNPGMPGEPAIGKGVIDIRALRLTDS